MRELFTFDDVLITPKFSFTRGRGPEYINLKSNIRYFELPGLPVISANMDTVTGAEMAIAMMESGAQACLHRFGTIEETVNTFKVVRMTKSEPLVSVGLGKSEIDRAVALYDAGAHAFVLDVAHGAQISVVEQTKMLREVLGSHVIIIVGNFATGESVKTFMEHSGAIVDGVKVGIGPGSACTTRTKTGVGVPQLSAVLDVAQTLKNTDIVVIADGGMKKAGDIAKALAAGAHIVMLGGMLAGTDETPGDTVWKLRDGSFATKEEVYPSHYVDGVKRLNHEYPVELPAFKKYRGSASMESYEAQGKKAKHRAAEGEAFYVPAKGPVEGVLQDIEGGIRSSISYVGATNLKEYPGKVEFVRISGATQSENGAHGKSQ